MTKQEAIRILVEEREQYLVPNCELDLAIQVLLKEII